MRHLAKMEEVMTFTVGENMWMTNSNELTEIIGKMRDSGENWSDRRISEGYGEKNQ